MDRENTVTDITLGISLMIGVIVGLQWIGWYSWFREFSIKYGGGLLFGFLALVVSFIVLNFLWGMGVWAYHGVRRKVQI